MRRLATLIALLAALIALAAGCGDSEQAEPASDQPPAATATPAEPAPTEPTPTAPTPTEPLPPPTRPMSWTSAGAFVWHENDIDPGLLAAELESNGFGWVAVFLHEGTTEDPVEADWVRRFRLAGGLPVGGWGVLRTAPRLEAALAQELVGRYGLDFYIANAEAEYELSGVDGLDGRRHARSRRFVQAFRDLAPALPAGVSSYCRADMHDIDWAAWRAGGFVFLPQAYANDFGGAAAPDICAKGALAFFPLSSVHPTIGMYPGQARSPAAAEYVPALARAGTTGFSVYLAETRMTSDEWRALGQAISERAIAR